MLLTFFLHLRAHRIPVSIREFLDLLGALGARLAVVDTRQFYFLSRLCLVKDEKYFDRFDLAFDAFFNDLETWQGAFETTSGEHLLRQSVAEALGDPAELDLARLLAQYRQAVERVRQAARRRDGAESSAAGNEKDDSHEAEDEQASAEEEWRLDIGERSRGYEDDEAQEADTPDDAGDDGDGGDDGEGESGEEREGEGEDGDRGTGSGGAVSGERDGGDEPPQRLASKVWQRREFADYDPEVELGTRNMKLALRRLRKFARTAAALELDLDGTIAATAKNGGILDIIEIPERHNAVKVLLFLDVGGSMDEHIALCARLFSAARSEFKYMDHFYFHNFIYESVWRNNDRRSEDRTATLDLLNKFGADYKIIFVGDASMARHEIAERGGSVEHFNSETGEVWMSRFHERFKKVVWLNPVEPKAWDDSYSIEMIRRLMADRMYHLSVAGIEEAMKYLRA